MKIVIIDYGVGNLANVAKAIKYLGYEVEISSKINTLRQAELLILPGVGSFYEGMKNIQNMGADEIIKNHILQNKPFLGICLGFQLLFEYSLEHGKYTGLGIFKGAVKNLADKINLKIPHMGWNELIIKNDPKNLLNIGYNSPYYYFVHSYYVEPEDKKIILSETEYGIKFASAIYTPNLLATQFHPEKSGSCGLALLANFLRNIDDKK